MTTNIWSERRSRVTAALGDDGALVLAAGPELRVGPDGDLRYVPDADLFYLTGYAEPEAVLALCPAASEPFTMFVRPRDPERERWTGVRGGPDEAVATFGADAAYPIQELGTRLPSLVGGSQRLYARMDGARPEVEASIRGVLAAARRNHPRTGRGPLTLIDPGVLLGELRLVKSPPEVALMREAAGVTVAAFREAARRVHPGAGEWEVEAALDGGFRRRGADGPAFATIVASGPNATVLHYMQNDRPMQSGELVLLDAGARYQGYCADITRTLPVSGTFKPEQRALYEVVLAAHDAGIAAARPGAPVSAVHTAALHTLLQGLVDLRLLEGTVEALAADESSYRTFYPHRTSHWLGLDVHDAGNYVVAGAPLTLEPGMVLTVEPGLYIAPAADAPAGLRGTGIRIEDDVLVTEAGPEVLTEALPTDAVGVLSLLEEGG